MEWLKQIGTPLKNAIFWAETLKGKTGEEKLNIVVEKITGLIPNIPGVPDWLETPIKRAALKPIVSLAVEKLNWIFGWNFKDATLTDEQAEKLAEVIEAPEPVVAKAMASVPADAPVDVKLEALYREYKVVPITPDPLPESHLEAIATPGVESTSDWDRSIAFVLAREGGYVNDPADKGGETNMGITAATLAGACAAGLVGHCNVKALTQDEAKKIYRANYWDRYGWGAVAWPASLCLFDATVNHGGGGMAKIAQRTANALTWKLDVDGKFGPKTLESIQRVTAADAKEYTEEFLRQRKKYYDEIIDRNNSQEKFRKGWYNRIKAIAEASGVKSPL
jgi:lysozyme family protein